MWPLLLPRLKGFWASHGTRLLGWAAVLGTAIYVIADEILEIIPPAGRLYFKAAVTLWGYFVIRRGQFNANRSP
jgi:hypothetical protein